MVGDTPRASGGRATLMYSRGPDTCIGPSITDGSYLRRVRVEAFSRPRHRPARLEKRI